MPEPPLAVTVWNWEQNDNKEDTGQKGKKTDKDDEELVQLMVAWCRSYSVARWWNCKVRFSAVQFPGGSVIAGVRDTDRQTDMRHVQRCTKHEYLTASRCVSQLHTDRPTYISLETDNSTLTFTIFTTITTFSLETRPALHRHHINTYWLHYTVLGMWVRWRLSTVYFLLCFFNDVNGNTFNAAPGRVKLLSAADSKNCFCYFQVENGE